MGLERIYILYVKSRGCLGVVGVYKSLSDAAGAEREYREYFTDNHGGIETEIKIEEVGRYTEFGRFLAIRDGNM